jgi:hypothetical protein
MPAKKNTTPPPPTSALPAGTRVLNTNDGEPGTILGGYAWDAAEWTEYEVETATAVEIWKRADFVLMSEIQDAPSDGR